MSKKLALENLIELSFSQGYLLLDDIYDVSEKYNLSLSDADWLSNNIATRNIIVYDEKPTLEENENSSDYSQYDYETLYKTIIKEYPSMESFLQEVRTIKAAQYKEFRLLKLQYLDGNEFARNRMIETQIRVAVKNAWFSSHEYNWDFEDALSYALIGLTVAADKYDYDGNYAFPTYASYWIQQSLERGLVSQNPLIYIPVHAMLQYAQIYKLFRKLNDDEFSSVIDNEELYNRIKVKIPGISNEIIFKLLLCCYNNLEFTDDFIDKYNHEYSAEDILINNDLVNSIESILETLQDKEKHILELRYGLKDDRELTLEALGTIFGVTRERIRQIEAKAIKKLRHPSRIKLLKALVTN